ncbi:hypothetical protein Y032_0295g1657 [Ancylostoma ceylanicum]|uniref:Saposin B-type domain-containing protein n=1 Tax=Ancylostoma ceylanicum TaxID=53326 RepID=A0A016S4Q6_9BILA|nr:hypothetical protein Y032_0295g1657 [Ancylostoma ceylanicum]
MKTIFLAAVFSLSYLVAANDRDCRWECFNAAISYRNWANEADMDKRVMEECESFAERLHYPCSKAVKLILDNNEIRNTIEDWKFDVASDKETEKKVKKYCRKACRNRREQ